MRLNKKAIISLLFASSSMSVNVWTCCMETPYGTAPVQIPCAVGRDPWAHQKEKIFKLTEVATPVQKWDNNKTAFGTIAFTTFHNLSIANGKQYICLCLRWLVFLKNWESTSVGLIGRYHLLILSLFSSFTIIVGPLSKLMELLVWCINLDQQCQIHIMRN